MTLTNSGTASITISNVSILGPGFNSSGSMPTGQTLTPGQTVTVNVSFAPAAVGSVTGSVTVSSNAANSPTTIALSGTGVQGAVPHSTTLFWNLGGTSVVGYNVYGGTVSGGPYTKLTNTPVSTNAYTDSTVQCGTTYYYTVTAVDSNNTESGYSNQASILIP